VIKCTDNRLKRKGRSIICEGCLCLSTGRCHADYKSPFLFIYGADHMFICCILFSYKSNTHCCLYKTKKEFKNKCVACWKTEFFLVLQIMRSAHCTTTIDTKKEVWQVYSKILRSLIIQNNQSITYCMHRWEHGPKN
jgi:hypothetical protein